jgi:hypothetical protein
MGELIKLMRQLVGLAQERNTLTLAILMEARDSHKLLREMETDMDEQSVILASIAAEMKPPPPSLATQVFLTLGTQVPQ